MTYFALALWVWQQTESATALALILFFYQLPQIAIALFSGILVDRVPRKRLLFLSDIASACCTLAVGLLAATQTLQIGHVYFIAALVGCFGNIQAITYSTTVPLIVPKRHHTRASSMGAMVSYSDLILAPAFAGVLYPSIGLLGITTIDIVTFAIGLLTLAIVPIPRTIRKKDTARKEAAKDLDRVQKIWHETTFGFRYIASQPSLLAMVLTMSAFAFFNQMCEALYQPLILARTGGNTQILGIVVAASGFGGVIGAIVFSVWGGFRQRVSGLLVGFVGTGLSRLILGFSRLPALWSATQFGSSFHSPLIFSSYMGIWYAKVASDLQGRVFAADYLIGLGVEASASLTAGLLADRLFEPAMGSGTGLASLFTPVFGTGTGSGIALAIALSSLGMISVGIGGFSVRHLRDVETIAADRMPSKSNL